jgi:predicted lipase
MQGAAGVTHAVVDATGVMTGAVVDATTDLVVTATSITPVLKNIVKMNVHSGFWDAYMQARTFVHSTLRRELVKTPTSVFFTGHSLGGALCTFAAIDVSLHSIPRVTKYLMYQDK